MSSPTKHGVKGRVYLTPEEAPAAARQFGCARFVYNHLLEFSRSRYFTNKTKTSPAQRSLELTRLKSETPWLQEVNAQALQQTGRALDRAYQNWFDSITGKRPDKVNPSKFKKKSQRQSARFTRGAFSFDKNSGTLRLSKIGDIRIPWYRRVKGEPSSVVLSRTPSGRYHVSFQVEQPLRVVGSAQNFALYVDINIKTFNFFNGRKWSHVDLPRPLLPALARLRTAQKHLSRCTKGSKNREQARLRVAKMHQRVADTRTDFLQKLSTQLIHENQVIVVETLCTKNMLKNGRLAGVISDAGFCRIKAKHQYGGAGDGPPLVNADNLLPAPDCARRCRPDRGELHSQGHRHR